MAGQEATQQERTESATPKRRQEVREKGQVARSLELNSSAVLFASLLLLLFFGNGMMTKGQYYVRVALENIAKIELTVDTLQTYMILVIEKSAWILFPILAGVMVIGMAVNYAQVGFLFSGQPLLPKWSKIDPLNGFKRIFASKRALIELAKNIFKIIIIGVVSYFTVKGDIDNYIPLMDKAPLDIFSFVAWETFELLIKIVIVFLCIAVLDYAFQRYDFEESIKMTKQEVKDEYRQMEGDPHIKARIRAIRREQARQRMMQSVPEADVVITNPTFLAVAIQYDMVTMDAPVVVAKGARLIAERIRALAQENHIPIVQDKPLAQALFKACEPGDQIPEEFFQAIAEILAYVYRLKNKVIAREPGEGENAYI